MVQWRLKFLPFFLFFVCVAGSGGCGQLLGEDEEYVDAAFGNQQDDGENYIVIGFSQVGSESDWRNANTDSFKEAFTSEEGYYLLYEDAQQKQENQLKAVRNFILQEVDYIVLDPIVETGWDTVLMEAKDAGIPVIMVDRQAVVEDEGLYTCWVGSNFEEEGRRAGKWLEQYLESCGRTDGPIHIVTLQGTLESSPQIGRTQGFAQIMAQNPGWKMLECKSGEFTQAKGQEVMESFLAAYKDIDVIICENDNMAFGAIEAVESFGKSCGPKGDMVLISFDAVHAALQYMADGKIHADFECNPLLGPKVSEIIKKLERGEKVEKIQYVQEEYFDFRMDLGKILEERTAY